MEIVQFLVGSFGLSSFVALLVFALGCFFKDAIFNHIANQMNAAMNSVIKSEKPWPKEDLLDTDETWQHYKLQGK